MQSITDDPSDWNTLRRSFWRAGWHPLAVIGGIWLFGFALGNGLTIPGSFVLGRDGLGTQAVLSVAGAVAGLFVWTSSVRYVNRQTTDVEPELRRLVRRRFENESGLSVTVTTVGTRFGVAPARSYRVTATQVDGDSVVIERAAFDTERWALTDYPQVRMPRERLDGIDTERETFSVRIDDTVWNVEHHRDDARGFDNETTSLSPDGR